MVSVSCSPALHHVARLYEVTSGVFTLPPAGLPQCTFLDFRLTSAAAPVKIKGQPEPSGPVSSRARVKPSWDDQNKDLSTQSTAWKPGIVRNKLGTTRWMVLSTFLEGK